jgi:single-stranded-DNA-specific exonuclease
MPTESPKRWVFKHTDEVLIARQAEQLNISPFLARLLVLRGLADAESAKTYLSSSLRSDLPSPFAMAGMRSVERTPP